MPVAALVLLGALASAAVAQDAERLLRHAEVMRASEQALQQHARLASDLFEDSDLAFDLLYATVVAVRTLDFEEAARLAGMSARVRSAAGGGATAHRQLQLLRRLASSSRAGDFGTAASLLGELKEERGHLKLVPDLITLADVWLGWDVGRDQGEAVAVAVEEEEEKVEEGEAIFAQLLLVPGASDSRDDYYSAEEGWDLMALRSDLESSRARISQDHGHATATTAAAATAAVAAATATTAATAAAKAAAAKAATAAVAAAAKGGAAAETATAAVAVAAATTAVAVAEAATAAAKEAAAEEAAREAEKEAARKEAVEKEAEKEAEEASEHLLKEAGVAEVGVAWQPRVCLPATPCDDAGCGLAQPCSGGHRRADGVT